MNKNLFKILLSGLVLLIVLNVVIFKLYAIGAHNCTGTFHCDAIENACLEGEYLFAFPTAMVCYGLWNCRTYFRVFCYDYDAGDYYIRSAHCDVPAGAGECTPW